MAADIERAPSSGGIAKAALERVVAGGPADLLRFQAQELRERAAQMVRDAEAKEAEAAALEEKGDD